MRVMHCIQISRVLPLEPTDSHQSGAAVFSQTTSLLNKDCKKRRGQFCQEKVSEKWEKTLLTLFRQKEQVSSCWYDD